MKIYRRIASSLLAGDTVSIPANSLPVSEHSLRRQVNRELRDLESLIKVPKRQLEITYDLTADAYVLKLSSSPKEPEITIL